MRWRSGRETDRKFRGLYVPHHPHPRRFAARPLPTGEVTSRNVTPTRRRPLTPCPDGGGGTRRGDRIPAPHPDRKTAPGRSRGSSARHSAASPHCRPASAGARIAGCHRRGSRTPVMNMRRRQADSHQLSAARHNHCASAGPRRDTGPMPGRCCRWHRCLGVTDIAVGTHVVGQTWVDQHLRGDRRAAAVARQRQTAAAMLPPALSPQTARRPGRCRVPAHGRRDASAPRSSPPPRPETDCPAPGGSRHRKRSHGPGRRCPRRSGRRCPGCL